MTIHAEPVEPHLLPSLTVTRTIVWPLLEKQVRSLQEDLARVCLHHLGLAEAGDGVGTSKLRTRSPADRPPAGHRRHGVDRAW
ncbi:hypothetical protein [Streptomyces bauhiniae]